MAAKFLFLKNNGSPTRWDGTRYFEYLEQIRHALPNDLASLTSEERYKFPSESPSSFWHSSVTHLEVTQGELRIVAENEPGSLRFEMAYSGVKKIATTRASFRAMPWLVIQELVVLPNGLYRHSYSDIGGDCTTVYATGLVFRESALQ